MKTETVKLSQIEVNSANPRIISDDKFTKLVNSILALPKMLELRPIVVDNTMVALGGNMRYRALMAIADMQPEEMKERLSGIRDFQKKTAHEQTALIEYWERWQDNPTAPILKASELTEDEQKALQEIIDNYQPKDDDDAPLSDDGTQPSQEKDEWDDLLAEINHFRTPYMSKGLVAYERYPHIKECLKDGDIHIERDEQTGEIIGYLWMQDLKKKPLSRIYEIISNRKGLGRKLIEKAIAIKKQPTLQLYVLDYNTNAIEFYKHMGFVEVERETGQPKGKNNITMEYRGNAESE